MELKSCRKCKKLYQDTNGKPVCNVCLKLEEDTFIEIKDYLRKHRGASATEISEKFDVSIARIKRYVRDGRLEICDSAALGITCGRCGENINTGKYCRSCSDKLSSELEKASIGMNRPLFEAKKNQTTLDRFNR